MLITNFTGIKNNIFNNNFMKEKKFILFQRSSQAISHCFHCWGSKKKKVNIPIIKKKKKGFLLEKSKLFEVLL